ncbi:MAG: S9 family peptidase [Gemmatimonadaceae bacterium]
MTHLPCILLVVASSVTLVASPAPAQQAPSSDSVFTVARYLDYETVSDAKLSPSGAQLVYTRRWVDKQDDEWKTALWIMNADGTRNRFLTRGSNAVWSPDGTRIAYLVEGEPRGTQVWVRWMDVESAPSQVTRATESIGDLRWSPDGRNLGFSMFVPAKAPWKIDLPAAPQGAKWAEPPRHVDRLHYRFDRRGFLRPGFRHLFTVSADGGAIRQLTRGEWSVGYTAEGDGSGVRWDWSPDGRTILFDGFREPESQRTYRSGNIYALDIASGAITRLTRETGAWQSPVISPDGRRIAFVGTPTASYSYRVSDVYVMDADGSDVRKLSGGLDRDASSLHWAPDGSGVYFTADDRGTRNVHFASLAGGVRPVTRGTHVLTLGSLARNGSAAGIAASYHSPSDVVRIDLRRAGELTPLTRVNGTLLSGIRLGEVEEMWYPSQDGTRIQGWIVKPPGFDGSRKYPLIMEIHGGPHAMYSVAFNPMFQNFAAHGYVVIYTNPRGSTGYGSEFGNAIQRAYPSVDHHDLMAGVDELVRRGYIDTNRMFVGGCSGGGVLSSWAIAHTDRFAAAAVRCPVTNWLSMAGQTDIPLFTFNFFEKPFWEDPARWLEQSPLMHVGRVKTPTLLMTGELDLRTPMSQTEEYYAALKMRGVPSELLRFQGEYHGTGSKPSNWMRTQLYMMSWYERHGNARAAAAGGSVQ